MGKIFLTSDTHFNHLNILRYESETRPFSSIEEMNEAIIANWNSVVSPEDTVYHLGDFFMGRYDAIEDILDRLNGTIKLIRGNHDTKARLELYKARGIEVKEFSGKAFNNFPKTRRVDRLYISKNITYIPAGNPLNEVREVHYEGTEEEWNNVTICSGNEALLNAKIYCGDYKPTSASGTCGENLTWAFDSDTFTLTISGTGAMDDFYTDYFIDFRDPMDYIYEGNRPWETYKYEIKKIVISDGVTVIGNNAFRLFISLKEVEISNSVTKFNYRAIYDCDNLTDIYYSGTEEEWNSIENNTFENVTIHYNPCIHEYNQTVTTPTCTEQGYTTYTCECGDTYVADYVDAIGHTPSDSIEENYVTPTCTETGNKDVVIYCSACNEEISREVVTLEANGHTPATAVEENYVAPTCTENGSKDVVVYCSVCNEEISRETVIIDATDHADNDGDGYCDTDNALLDPSVECDHTCHKGGISGFIWKIINFFNKLFGLNKTCDCGVAHY